MGRQVCEENGPLVPGPAAGTTLTPAETQKLGNLASRAEEKVTLGPASIGSVVCLRRLFGTQEVDMRKYSAGWQTNSAERFRFFTDVFESPKEE